DERHIEVVEKTIDVLYMTWMKTQATLSEYLQDARIISLDSNPQLTNVDGLMNIDSIGVHCVLKNNQSLASIAGLSNVRTLGANIDTIPPSSPGAILVSLSLDNLPLVTDIDALKNVEKLSGAVSVKRLDLLTEINAFEKIDSLYGRLWIWQNDHLNSLYGLRNLTFLESGLLLGLNPMLDDCCGLYNYASAIGFAAMDSQFAFQVNGLNCTAANILQNGPCLEPIDRIIAGSAYADVNQNCQEDGFDLPFAFQIVKALPGPRFAATDANGDFELIVRDTGTYTVSLLANESDMWTSCDSALTTTVLTTDSLITIADQGIQRDSCPQLTLDVGGFWSRRCFPGSVSISYCNLGAWPALQSELVVALPAYIDFISASRPHTVNPDGSLLFDLGTVLAESCGTLTLNVQESCTSVETLGLTQCIEAWLTSPDLCKEVSAAWDGSSLALEARCINNLNQFLVINDGADMDDSTAYRIFADTLLVQNGMLQLTAGDTMSIVIPGNGQSFRLEVDQVPFHPNNVMVSAVLEGCVATLLPSTSRGYVNLYPAPVRLPDPLFATDCQTIIGAYDPNDKQVFPIGLGSEGKTQPGSRLKYLIRFQNTGTDTAFNVVITDTLSPNLDLSSLQIGASSHPYEFNVSGNGVPVLEFSFNNIQLPDSNINEPASHGFVQFSIDHLPNAPLGTIIENFADIFFDFNPPIRTNTTVNTLSVDQPTAIGSVDGIVIDGPILVLSNELPLRNMVRLYPNPTHDVLQVDFGNTFLQGELICYDLFGRKVASQSISGTSSQFKVKNLPDGMYLLTLDDQVLGKFLKR
ncbi:MAG: T9SS type A sorting domain-containing protein, partial [Bacteroidota bacterium]